MSRLEYAPFQRGASFLNGIPLDTTNPPSINWLGKTYESAPNSQDSNSVISGTQDPNGRISRLRIVRNASGINLKPGRLVKYLVTPGIRLETQVDGYVSALADIPAGVVDEFLPAAGVPPGDLFFIVEDGPTLVTSMHTGTPALSPGGRLVPGAGTSATNDDAGRVDAQSLAGATATLGNNVLNLVGRVDDLSTLSGAPASISTIDTKFPAVVHLGRG